MVLHLAVEPFLYPLFKLTEQAGSICTTMLTVLFLSMALRSFCTTNIVGVLRGGGDVKMAALIDILPLWAVSIPLAYLFGLVLGKSILWVYLAMASEQAIKCILGFLRYRTGKWVRDVTQALPAEQLP